MVTPGNTSEATTDLYTIIHDPDIDAKSIARPGRDVHVRGEIAESKQGQLKTQTVSMDTFLNFRITVSSFQMA